jgi:uncharacterized membrane protein YdbT with pleckstrin-like domain
MTTPQQTRRHIAIGLGVIVVIAAIAALIATAIPAHGQIIVITPLPRPTATMPARAWLMAQNNYAAPVASSCEAPGLCEGESR